MPDAFYREILRSAYATDGEALDELARRLGADTWSGLTADLTFHEEGTGGGMGHLAAELPGGHRLLITDGEAGVPVEGGSFLLVVVDEDEQELHGVSGSGAGAVTGGAPEARLHVLILSSRWEDNPYGDTDESYVFPRTYLPRFEPLTRGEPTLALVYEPRRGGGRQEYVAWGMLSGTPVPRSDGQYEVRYDGKLVPLPRPCPLTDATGRPFEIRLQVVPRRRWGGVLQGQSVRSATTTEAAEILAFAGLLVTSDVTGVPSERAVELVRRSVRDRGFRGQVLSAYAFRCAVTGFTAPASESQALLDAAHLRPVAAAGADHVRNGLALSAGVHRLFDEGLVAFGYEGGQVRLETSPVLETLTLHGQGGHLHLETGMALLLPVDPRAWPDPDALAWHRGRVFRR